MKINNKTIVNFTDSAALKVKQLITEENNNKLKLRVYITGGGCSGFKYCFTFDEKTRDDDTIFKKYNISLLIDNISLQYLLGADIDYKEDIKGERFIIRNPHAKSSCSCGSSFSI